MELQSITHRYKLTTCSEASETSQNDHLFAWAAGNLDSRRLSPESAFIVSDEAQGPMSSLCFQDLKGSHWVQPGLRPGR